MSFVSILYITGGIYSLNWTSNVRVFEKLFIATFIYFQNFCQKSAERKLPKEYLSYFVLMSGLRREPWLIATIRAYEYYKSIVSVPLSLSSECNWSSKQSFWTRSKTYTERQKWVNTTEIIHFLRIARKVNENSRINFQK